MEKKNRICFYSNKVIGDEVFKKLEELGFKRNGDYPSEYENLRSDYVLIEKNNGIEDWSGNERSYKERDLDFHDATEVSINDIFEGRVKPYKQSNLMEPDEVRRRLSDGEDPLNLSIEKYERLIEADFEDIEEKHIGSTSCACCQKYNNICEECPIGEITGRMECEGISYYDMRNALHLRRKRFFKYAKKILEELKDIRKKLKKKKDIIKCPFKMDWGFSSGDGLGIPFNDQKQTLFYSDFNSVYKVMECKHSLLTPCNLVPVDEDEREVGGTYFHTDETNENDKDSIDQYCKYLGDGKHVYPTLGDKGVLVSDMHWEHWYKVVPRETK
jgi:hypothetical protein